MRVCFDLRIAQKSSKLSGIGIYAYEVGKRLSLLNDEIYFLVLNNYSLPFEIDESKLIKVSRLKKPESLQEIWDPIFTKRALIKKNIELFHTPSPGLIKSNSKFKVITTIHDVIPDIFKEEKLTPFYSHVLYRIKNKISLKSDLIIFDSEYSRKDYSKVYGDIKKYKVIYLGADQSNFIKKSDINFQQYKEYMFYIGGFNKRKNFNYLLDLFPLIEAENNLNFVIGGNISKKQKNEIEYLRIKKNISKTRIIYTGKLNSFELTEFYKNCKFFIYPSLYEGFGLPIAEALMQRSLIFTTNKTSIPEIGGDAVIYISGDNVEKDSKIINDVINNEKQLKEIKSRIEIRKNNFIWDNTVKNINTSYENI